MGRDAGQETVLEKLCGGWRPYLLLSLLCLILYLPGLAAVPALDRDESRFVQATRQMLESGDYIRIQFQDEMRAKKPVGAYWAQAASVSLFSDPASTTLWPYRLPSALAAWGAVLMIFAFGRHVVGRQAALLGAGLLGSCLILVAEGHQAKTDALLLACTVAAQGALSWFYVAGRRAEAGIPHAAPGVWTALIFWLAQGAAILVKGPVVPMVSLLTVLALSFADRRFAWLMGLRPVLGIAIAAAIVAPWFSAITTATGGAFVDTAIRHDLLPKLLGAHESHGGVPGTYLLLASLTFWPASLLLWPALARAWRERLRPEIRVLLAWAIPAWVMFELIPTKLPHYVLPTYPALALMAALLVLEGADTFRPRAARLWYAAWTVVALVLAAAVVVLPMHYGSGFDLGAVPAAVAIALAGMLPAWLAWKGRMVHATLALALTAVATFPVVFEGVLPRLDRLWVSRSVAQVVATIGALGPVASAGYSEPSLVVMLGTATRLTNGAGAAHFLAEDSERRLAVVNAGEEAAFLETARAAGLEPKALGKIEGFNYSRGKPVAITVWGGPRP